MSCTPKVQYTRAELDNAIVADLLNDARCSREQADNGPFYPERGITREMCLAYAEDCEAKAARYTGGREQHATYISGKF